MGVADPRYVVASSSGVWEHADVSMRYEVVELDAHFDGDGISYAHDRRDGSFNVWGNTFPAETLPPSGAIIAVGGVPFEFPNKDDGALNNLSCAGQVIDVTPGVYEWIYVLAASERRSEDPIALHYVSGAVEHEWLRVSDFWPQTAPRFGELEAIRCPYMHYPRHTQEGFGPVIWRQRVAVTRPESLARIVLPDNVAIHVFAMTMARPVP